MSKLIFRSILLSCVMISNNLYAQTIDHDVEEKAILATMDAFFEALANNDRGGLEATTLPGSVFMTSARDENGRIVSASRSRAEIVDGLSSPDAKRLERYWNPTVLIREGIAVFWAPYDFHINGNFSHCGIDSFQLFKIDGEWLIGSSSFNRERTGCDPSPLGPIDE